MCLAKIKKWFCKCSEPKVIIKTEVKAIKEIEKMPTHLDVDNIEDNKKIATYLKSLTMTLDQYRQNFSIREIKIEKDKHIIVNNSELLFDGSLYA